MRFFVLLLVLSVTGCSARMVSTRGDSKSAYAPINEADSRAGTIKYLNQGAAFVKKARRESAYRQMHDHCGGPYKVTSEGPKAEGGVAAPLGGIAVYHSSEYWYLTFECQ